MISFKTLAILNIIFAIITIVSLCLFIMSIIKNDTKKTKKLEVFLFIISTFMSIIIYQNITIPPPTIYPLDSETQTYNKFVLVTIESNEQGFLKPYYSLDGSEPKNGEKYNSPIKIEKSTTVCARNKFLWWWSKIEKTPYKFTEDTEERTPPITANEKKYLNFIQKYMSNDNKQIFVKALDDFVIVRSAPTNFSEAITLLDQGDIFLLTSVATDDEGYMWYQILLDEDYRGYVPSGCVEIVTQ